MLVMTTEVAILWPTLLFSGTVVYQQTLGSPYHLVFDCSKSCKVLSVACA